MFMRTSKVSTIRRKFIMKFYGIYDFLPNYSNMVKMFYRPRYWSFSYWKTYAQIGALKRLFRHEYDSCYTEQFIRRLQDN
jgi:hypothetical protein